MTHRYIPMSIGLILILILLVLIWPDRLYDHNSLKGCSYLNDIQATSLADDKHLTKLLLKKHNLPSPNGFIIKTINPPSIDRLKQMMIRHGVSFPVVLKPVDDYGGHGVVTNIRDIRSLKHNINKASGSSEGYLIEEMVSGTVYRILYVNNRLIGIAPRERPYIHGDGVTTISGLVNRYNERYADNYYVYPISINDGLLKSQGYRSESIPRKNVRVWIDDVLNFHGGAITNSMPIHNIHPDNKSMFEKAFSLGIGGKCIGIDFVSPDIRESWKVNGGKILEFNGRPSLELHQKWDPGFSDRYTETIGSS